MKHTISYHVSPFDIELVIDDGHIEILTKKLSPASAILAGDFVVVCGGIPYGDGKLENPDGTERDLRHENTNVLCFDLEGNLKWRIQPCDTIAISQNKYPYSPWLGIEYVGGKLYACNRDGWDYVVNMEDGSVTKYTRMDK